MKSIYTVIILMISISFLSGKVASRSDNDTSSVKFAMAQIFILDDDRSGNLVRIENAIREAKKQQVDIVTFPEMCILGWANPDAFHRAFPIPGNDSDVLCQLAKKYNIFISIGLAEKENEKLYDSVILIDNEGNILLKHRKINTLSCLMTPPYTRGTEVNVVKTKFGNIGLLICADTADRSLVNRMKEKKPDLLLVPYGWAAEEKEWPEHGQELVNTVKNAAQIVGCPVIGTDLIGEITHGPWSGQTYAGLSVAYHPAKDELIIGKDRDSEIIVFSFDMVKH